MIPLGIALCLLAMAGIGYYLDNTDRYGNWIKKDTK